MASVLVDTDVFSFRLKRDTRAALYEPRLNGNQLHLSFATVAELYRWSILRQWGTQRVQALEQELTDFTVIPSDNLIAWEWARVMSVKGRPIQPGDAWIAATAIRHNLPLVTHNRGHFQHVSGLTVISEG